MTDEQYTVHLILAGAFILFAIRFGWFLHKTYRGKDEK